MAKEQKKNKVKKPPISPAKIYTIMCVVTIAVSFVFFLKNLLGGAIRESLVIGGSIVAFLVVMLILKLAKAKDTTKQMVISIALMLMIFLIAINSGEYFSDDFIMFLAVIALTGMYLEPKYSTIQLIMATIALIVMFVLYPQKADPLGQYVQCIGEFVLTGILFIQVIKRGRAFIGIGEERAKEAEGLVESIQEMGESLESDFAKSAESIDNNTSELQKGSDSIVRGAHEMNESCNDVQDRIQASQQSILDLNEDVLRFEIALRENQSNMENMQNQLAAVATTINEANQVFQSMEQKMGEVAEIADQLGNISFNTSLLSLNASIEAARAGESGAGFDVVATEMRQLSSNSNVFSEQVSEVVKELMQQVGQTASQLEDSTKALEESKSSMDELQDSFHKLQDSFGSLYGNIETQNDNVNQVNVIFNDLKERVYEMQASSETNQEAVKAIMDTMEMYRVNINNVILNTRKTEKENI